MNLASADWGSVPAWVSALTPLILAGVITRAMNRTTATLKEALRTTRPRGLRTRLRSIAAASRTTPDQAVVGGHHGVGTGHHGDPADVPDSGGE